MPERHRLDRSLTDLEALGPVGDFAVDGTRILYSDAAGVWLVDPTRERFTPTPATWSNCWLNPAPQ